MTAPFDSSVATLITGPHRQTVSAVATDAAGAIPLEILPGSSIDWTERRSPCVSATLVCAIPSPAQLARLDPRLSVRVKITAGYYLASGALSSAQVADLHLRLRTVDRPAGRMTLTAASDEFLVIDGSRRAQPLRTPYTVTSIAAGIKAIIQAYLPAATVVSTGGVKPGSTQIGTDYWRAIEDLADIDDLDVYDEGDRVFHIDPRPYVASATVATLTTGPGGTILSSTATVDRDDFANDVQLYYEWEDAVTSTTASVTGWAALPGSHPFAEAHSGLRAYAEQRVGPISQAAADAAAATMLRRLVSRSRTIDLTAVAMWWVRPRRTITVQLPTGEQQRMIVAAVSFDLADHSMRVLTRAPETDTALTGE